MFRKTVAIHHACLLLVFTLCAGRAYGAMYTWTGASSTSWNNSANWSPATVPNVNDDVVIGSAATYYPEITDSDKPVGQLGSLTIGAVANIHISSSANIIVTGTFVNQGTIWYKNTARIVNDSDEPLGYATAGTVIYADNAAAVAAVPYYTLDIRTTCTAGTIPSVNTLVIGSGRQLTAGNVTIEEKIDINGEFSCTDLTFTGGALSASGTGTLTISNKLTSLSGIDIESSSIKVILSGGPVTVEKDNAFSAVEIADASVTFTGSNTFKTLACTQAGGRTLTFQAGGTQTVANTLKLSGSSSSSLLALKSTSDNVQWKIRFTGSQTPATFELTMLSVRDSQNDSAFVFPLDDASISGGNNTNWAANYVWTGSTSDEWETAANWNAGGGTAGDPPSEHDTILIPGSLARYPVFAAIDRTAKDLEIQAGAQLTFSSSKNLSLTGTLKNIGEIIYKSNGRIKKGSAFFNDSSNGGTVTYSGPTGTITGSTYANLTVSHDGGIWQTDASIIVGNTLKVQGTGGEARFTHAVTVSRLLTVDNGGTAVGSTLTFTGDASEVTGSGSISAQHIVFSPSLASATLSISAAEITVSGNITVSTGKINAASGTIKLTGTAATVSGNNTFATVTCTGANITFTGSNTFTVLEATGTNITFNGSNTFETLTCIEAGGRVLAFAAGTTQRITTKLALTGTNVMSLLTLKSNTPGSRWNIQFEGIPQASNLGLRYLDVTDSENISPDVFKAAYSKTTDTSRNNVRWTDPPSPEFILTVAPLGEKQLLIVFSTELEIDMIKGAYALEKIKDNLMIESIDAPGTRTHEFVGNARTAFRNYEATGLIFTLNKTITLDDLQKTCIRVLDTVGAEQDILPGKWIPYIQNTDGGYIRGGSAHALSDFAVNAVQPLYAYDSGSIAIGTTFDVSKSFTIRNWDKEQLANGSLLVDKDIYIQTQLFDGTNGTVQTFDANIYLDRPSYMGNTGSSEINNKTGLDWRVWLPTAFNNLSSNNNADFIQVAGNAPDGLQKLFYLPVTTDSQYAKWQRDDQITFMFDIRDTGGTPINIIHGHDPTYNGSSYSGSPAPLYALRLKNSNDLTSLDLWSFRLKTQTTQRGGVSIFNNVVNANSGENVLIKVNVPKAGRLSVAVMTLDGSVVQYLERGPVQQGERVYSWNGTATSGKKVARGMYFVRIVGAGIDETRKVMVVKE
ncbi:MAG: hypothetical protein IJR50_09315 [Treponema sp.]|nr:hypothetical protein [Treponema sp.]